MASPRLRPDFGSGEDRNAAVWAIFTGRLWLRPDFGSGEDRNENRTFCARCSSTAAPGLRLGRGSQPWLNPDHSHVSLTLRPDFGSGEDRNHHSAHDSAVVVGELRPDFGSGEDRNALKYLEERSGRG